MQLFHLKMHVLHSITLMFRCSCLYSWCIFGGFQHYQMSISLLKQPAALTLHQWKHITQLTCKCCINDAFPQTTYNINIQLVFSMQLNLGASKSLILMIPDSIDNHPAYHSFLVAQVKIQSRLSRPTLAGQPARVQNAFVRGRLINN